MHGHLFHCCVSRHRCWKWGIKDVITLESTQDHIRNWSAALVHTLYLGFSLLQRNGQLTLSNKASLSANSTFQGTLVWQSRAAAAGKEITGFHKSLSIGRNVWGYIHSILLSRVETLIGEVQEELAKALTFINFLPLPSYLTFIPHDNPKVNVTALLCRGRIGDSGRLSQPNSFGHKCFKPGLM